MENKNVILAIVLSLGFLFFWTMVVVPRFSPPPPAPNPEATRPSVNAGRDTAHEPAELKAAHPVSPEEAAVPGVLYRDTRNEVEFVPQGGGVRHWRLHLKGREIDLVASPDTAPYPLSTFPDATFKIQISDLKATMDTTIGALALRKTLTFNDNGYLNQLTLHFSNPTGQALSVKDLGLGWGPGIGTSDTERKENSKLTRALFMGKLNAHAMKPGQYDDPAKWTAIDNRYFLVAFVPGENAHPTIQVTGTKEQTDLLLVDHVDIPAHGETTVAYQLYAGPKGYTQLRHYGLELQEAVDFGFFSPVGKVILQALYWLDEETKNYGWSIVILTIILQLLMLPLSMKSFKAANAMKKLQPQIALLQKAHKEDPKRLNIEMMNLYKKSGTNPLGGCLPMVLQVPIFWALFTTLRNAYELRGAPWIFWIHDLSAPDPLRILPVVMGLAMFAQQRMTGATTDPTQRQMMLIMPIMFTVMGFNFPVGLVLYWMTNNLMSMSVQWVVLQRLNNGPSLGPPAKA